MAEVAEALDAKGPQDAGAHGKADAEDAQGTGTGVDKSPSPSLSPPAAVLKGDEKDEKAEEKAVCEENMNKEQKEESEERKIHEDDVLQKAAVARAVTAAANKANQLPCVLPPRNRTHWDYVMEEMAWLAYDFAQERIWKLSAAKSVGKSAAQAAADRMGKELAAQTAAERSSSGQKEKKTMKGQVVEKDDSARLSPGTPPLDEEETTPILVYDCPIESCIELFANLEEEQDKRIQEGKAMLVEYEKKLEEHRKLSAEATAALEAAAEKEKVQIAREQIDKVRKAMAAQKAAQSGHFLFDDVTVKKKGKRKNKKMANLNLSLTGMSDIHVDNSDLHHMPHAAFMDGQKPMKKLKVNSNKMVIGPIMDNGQINDMFGDNKLKKNKKKKKKQGDFSLHPSMKTGLDPSYQQGMMPFGSIAFGDQGKSKNKSKAKNKKDRNDAKQSQLSHLRSGVLDAFNPNSMLPFGDTKVDIAQMMMMGGTSSSKSQTKKSSGKKGSDKSGLSDLLKIQLKDSKKKSHKSSSKSKAAGNNDADLPWTIAEDQVLCAIVHEFGSNWSLVADVLFSTYSIRGIHRRPSACRQKFKWICSSASSQSGGSDSKDQEPYVVALKVNKGNARMLLQHVMPADEEMLKKHLDVIMSTTSKHKGNKPHLEHQKSSKEGMQLVEMHPSHKNAQAVASRGQMLMNPGALCEYVNSTSLGMKVGADGVAGNMHMSNPVSGSLMGRNYSDVLSQGSPHMGRSSSLDNSHNMSMVAAPRMHQKPLNSTAALAMRSDALPNQVLSPRSKTLSGSHRSSGMLPLPQMDSDLHMQQRYMMAYHSQPMPSMQVAAMNRNPYGHQHIPQSMPVMKKDSQGKGKARKGSQKKQSSTSLVTMPSESQIPGYLEGPMETMPSHLDPHATLPSGMHSLGSTMHMMQSHGAYDAMPPKGMPVLSSGYPVAPSLPDPYHKGYPMEAYVKDKKR